MHLKNRRAQTSHAGFSEKAGNDDSDIVEKAGGFLKSEKALLSVLIVFRLINAALCRTWFVADEYWQSLEVAHQMVFRYLFRLHV